MANMLPKREEGKKETQWRLEDMYASNEAWEAETQPCCRENRGSWAAYQGRLRREARRFSWRCSGCTTRQICFFEKVLCVCRISGIVQAYRRQPLSGAVRPGADADGGAFPGGGVYDAEAVAGPAGGDGERFIFRRSQELEMYRHACREIVRFKEHTLDAAQEALLAKAGEMAESPGIFFPCSTTRISNFPPSGERTGSPSP